MAVNRTDRYGFFVGLNQKLAVRTGRMAHSRKTEIMYDIKKSLDIMYDSKNHLIINKKKITRLMYIVS